MTSDRTELQAAARRLAALLKERRLQIVFAESCTAGLVSATLGAIPGISAHHCGSAVVYQVDTKSRWLGIPKALLESPGPVSREVAAQMATRVLAKTPQADLAVSVTGHLGPDAPKAQDGLIFAGVAIRTSRGRSVRPRVVVRKLRLEPGAAGQSPARLRMRRQAAAALFVLETAQATLARSTG
jgi:PncC family amidohydrolase